jgi:hypothetical protein
VKTRRVWRDAEQRKPLIIQFLPLFGFVIWFFEKGAIITPRIKKQRSRQGCNTCRRTVSAFSALHRAGHLKVLNLRRSLVGPGTLC